MDCLSNHIANILLWKHLNSIAKWTLHLSFFLTINKINKLEKSISTNFMRQDTLFLFHNFEYFEVNKKLDNMGRNKRLKLEKSFVGEIIKKQAENIPSCEDITKLKVTFHNKNKPKVLNKKVAKNSQLEILGKIIIVVLATYFLYIKVYLIF